METRVPTIDVYGSYVWEFRACDNLCFRKSRLCFSIKIVCLSTTTARKFNGLGLLA